MTFELTYYSDSAKMKIFESESFSTHLNFKLFVNGLILSMISNQSRNPNLVFYGLFIF